MHLSGWKALQNLHVKGLAPRSLGKLICDYSSCMEIIQDAAVPKRLAGAAKIQACSTDLDDRFFCKQMLHVAGERDDFWMHSLRSYKRKHYSEN